MRSSGGSDPIYDTLRTDILNGSLGPATPLREVHLAQRFEVSRTPVREALARLQQDGLLVRSRRGLEVRTPDPHQLMQVYDLRIMLEQEAATQAAAARTEADVARLEGLLDRDQALQEPDGAIRITTNLEFHAALWASAHNPALTDLLGKLNTHVVHAPHSTLDVGDRWVSSLEEHAAMVEAIRGGDGERAGRLAGDHMRTARRLRLSLLRQEAVGQSRVTSPAIATRVDGQGSPGRPVP